MGDFLIDLTAKEERKREVDPVAFMSYYDDLIVKTFDHDRFVLFLSRCDDWELWAPYWSRDQKVFTALAGRIALDDGDWTLAERIEGEGGLACKAIHQLYEKGGIDNLRTLNGSFTVILFDEVARKLYVVNDRCGMHPCFSCDTKSGNIVISSHPDLLARYAGIDGELDLVSISEFLMTGKVTFPHTYYQAVASMDYGCIHELDTTRQKARYQSKKKYFDFAFDPDTGRNEMELARELGGAIKRAVNRRTQKRFGQTGISLSGGMDSRTILCAAENRKAIHAFCFYEEENLEYQTARSIAQALGVKFLPIKREPYYYGDQLEMGVKLSAGLGNVYSNHYLGARDTLVKSGISNIVAGFYCDFLFKGYLLDKKTSRFFLNESLSTFRYERYEPLFMLKTKYWEPVQARLDGRYPKELREDPSDRARLEMESRRMFPLCYDSESLETLVPQKVLGWYLPTIDNDIIDLYLKTPPRYKLNKSLFSKMVPLHCDPEIRDIVDANTGNRIGASHLAFLASRYKSFFLKKYLRLTKGMVRDGSWPDWQHMISTNPTIHSLWVAENAASRDVFHELLGEAPNEKPARAHTDKEATLFFRFLTIKTWLEQCRHHG